MMKRVTAEPNSNHHRQAFVRWLPMLLGLLTTATIYLIVAEQINMGPRWLLPGAIVLLATLLGIAIRRGHLFLSRQIAIVLLMLVTAALLLATGGVIVQVISSGARISAVPQATAIELLRNAALVWFVNVLTFSFWYWELDGGGPAQRLHMGYQSSDLAFPRAADNQQTTRWCPHYVDYLFLAFNTSTALSPTDTAILSGRAKLLMMIQSSISLIMIVIVAARAINSL